MVISLKMMNLKRVKMSNVLQFKKPDQLTMDELLSELRKRLEAKSIIIASVKNDGTSCMTYADYSLNDIEFCYLIDALAERRKEGWR